MFSDKNYLYLVFLKPILESMQRINKNFQSNASNSTKLLRDLMIGINALKTKIIPPDVDVDILVNDVDPHMRHDLYLGYEFESYLKTVKHNMTTRMRF